MLCTADSSSVVLENGSEPRYHDSTSASWRHSSALDGTSSLARRESEHTLFSFTSCGGEQLATPSLYRTLLRQRWRRFFERLSAAGVQRQHGGRTAGGRSLPTPPSNGALPCCCRAAPPSNALAAFPSPAARQGRRRRGGAPSTHSAALRWLLATVLGMAGRGDRRTRAGGGLYGACWCRSGAAARLAGCLEYVVQKDGDGGRNHHLYTRCCFWRWMCGISRAAAHHAATRSSPVLRYSSAAFFIPLLTRGRPLQRGCHKRAAQQQTMPFRCTCRKNRTYHRVLMALDVRH